MSAPLPTSASHLFASMGSISLGAIANVSLPLPSSSPSSSPPPSSPALASSSLASSIVSQLLPLSVVSEESREPFVGDESLPIELSVELNSQTSSAARDAVANGTSMLPTSKFGRKVRVWDAAAIEEVLALVGGVDPALYVNLMWRMVYDLGVISTWTWNPTAVCRVVRTFIQSVGGGSWSEQHRVADIAKGRCGRVDYRGAVNALLRTDIALMVETMTHSTQRASDLIRPGIDMLLAEQMNHSRIPESVQNGGPPVGGYGSFLYQESNAMVDVVNEIISAAMACKRAANRYQHMHNRFATVWVDTPWAAMKVSQSEMEERMQDYDTTEVREEKTETGADRLLPRFPAARAAAEQGKK